MVVPTHCSGQLAHLTPFPDNSPLGHTWTYAAQAHLGVYPLEGLGQDIANVGQVEQEQGHADYGIQNGDQLAPLGLGCNVAVSNGGDHRQGVEKGAGEAPLLHVGSFQLFLDNSSLILEQHIVHPKIDNLVTIFMWNVGVSDTDRLL